MADKKVLTGYGWYKLESIIQTNISREYLDGEKSWDTWAAMRECLQNAADEAEHMVRTFGGTLTDYVKVSLRSYKGGHVLIQDYGRGVSFENIVLLGKSDKRGQGYRGEKGEGQLMAFLTLAKLGTGIKMFSQDWMAMPCFVKYNGGDNEVLALALYKVANTDNPNRLSKGTVWLIDRNYDTENVVKNLDQYFPDLAAKVSKSVARKVDATERKTDLERVAKQRRDEQRRKSAIKRASTSSVKTVLMPKEGAPARLYLKGIYVKDLTVAGGFPCMFSYNMRNVSTNRDRDMVNQFEMKSEMAKALSSKDVTKAMMERFWDGIKYPKAMYQEFDVNITPHNPKLWRAALDKVMGQKACMFTNGYATRDAVAEGWTSINMIGPVAKLAEALGIPTDMQAGGYVGDVKLAKKLGVRELKILGLATEICSKLVKSMASVVVVEKAANADAADGWYRTSDKTVYLKLSVFAQGGLVVLMTMLHEQGHHNTDASDFNRPFTAWFLAGWMRAMLNADSNLAAKLEELRNM